jgi:acyl carrier protein
LPNDSQLTSDSQQVVFDLIEMLLARRGATGLEVKPEARLAEDLDFDSLELAELSAELEDRLGRDPYSEGIVPERVGDLVAFYNS